MSKNHREARKPGLFDWLIVLSHASGNVTTGFAQEQARITGARFTRDHHGGYTFTDDKGTVADYPPGTVLSVTRSDPDVWPLNLPAAQPDDAGFLDATADGDAKTLSGGDMRSLVYKRRNASPPAG